MSPQAKRGPGSDSRSDLEVEHTTTYQSSRHDCTARTEARVRVEVEARLLDRALAFLTVAGVAA